MVEQEASPRETLGFVAAIVGLVVFGGGLTAVMAWTAATGRDLQFFERVRTVDPQSFNRLIWIQRTNGVLIAMMCLGTLCVPRVSAFDEALWSALLIFSKR